MSSLQNEFLKCSGVVKAREFKGNVKTFAVG